MKSKINNGFFIFFVFITFFSFATFATSQQLLQENQEQYWDWDSRDTSDVHYPKTFLWGCATSGFQDSGTNCVPSNWTTFSSIDGNIKDNQRPGTSCDHWNKYPEDIKRMKDIGLNSFRFSLEWSTIEPEEGLWDNAAIEHYHQYIDALLAQGIKPMISLHHFTHPEWFEEKGAFENEENIEYFLRFSKKVFDEFHEKVDLWCTFNEPNIYVFQGYMRGVFPPAVCDIALAGNVLKNLLKAHVLVYKELKNRPGGDAAKIGIVHQHLLFKAYNPDSVVGYLERAFTGYLSHIVTRAIFDFLCTGKFTFKVIPAFNLILGGGRYLSSFNWLLPQLPYKTIEFEVAEDPQEWQDFIGLNYYSHVLIDFVRPWNAPAFRSDDIKTDMEYALYPEGIYHAISEVAEIGVPIYITETGVADAEDSIRELFFERYLYAISQAINDGYDVRGYYHWTLLDNFEWDMGFDMRFGLYDVDFETKERMLRPSVEYFKNVVLQSFA